MSLWKMWKNAPTVATLGGVSQPYVDWTSNQAVNFLAQTNRQPASKAPNIFTDSSTAAWVSKPYKFQW
jgi:hypothetical protein